MILAALALCPRLQQVERVNDPKVVATGREASLDLGKMWIKSDGTWRSMKSGELITAAKFMGKPAQRQNMVIRIRALGFRRGADRYCVVYFLRYDNVAWKDSGGWLLDEPSFTLVVSAIKGPLGALPNNGEAGIWKLPLLGMWSLDGEGFQNFYPGEGKTWNLVDLYVKKSFTAKLQGKELESLQSVPLNWPVFPATPKSGPVVRFQFPVENGENVGQSWDSFYFETSPKAWEKFTNEVAIMVGDRTAG